MPDLSAAEARRIALAAQGFTDPAPRGAVGLTHLRRVFRRVALIQIDSVNVLIRSQFLPPFARLGAYAPALLTRMAYERRELFEYWGHEASLIPIESYPLFRWRMERAARGEGIWKGLVARAREQRDYIERVAKEVAARGPLAVSDLEHPGARGESWGWGWADGKVAMEWLFWTGRVTATRTRTFERIYDLTDRVIPPAVLAKPMPAEEEAHRHLLALAARSLGVATARDLADYFRISPPAARPRIAELVEEGALVPARVEGWRDQAYVHPGARAPRRVEARALLSPFDSLVWFRPRTERLFDFHYRIEIYTPPPKRRHGYYVLPFLLGERIVARVDLKADRNSGTLRALAAYAEPGEATAGTATALAEELRRAASWLGLERVEAGRRGDLAAKLRAALRIA